MTKVYPSDLKRWLPWLSARVCSSLRNRKSILGSHLPPSLMQLLDSSCPSFWGRLHQCLCPMFRVPEGGWGCCALCGEGGPRIRPGLRALGEEGSRTPWLKPRSCAHLTGVGTASRPEEQPQKPGWYGAWPWGRSGASSPGAQRTRLQASS